MQWGTQTQELESLPSVSSQPDRAWKHQVIGKRPARQSVIRLHCKSKSSTVGAGGRRTLSSARVWARGGPGSRWHLVTDSELGVVRSLVG